MSKRSPSGKPADRRLNFLGKQIRRLRNEGNLTLAQLAARCEVLGWEVSHNTLGKIEAGARSIFDIEVWVLAKALRVTADDLYPRAISPEKVAESKRPLKRKRASR